MRFLATSICLCLLAGTLRADDAKEVARAKAAALLHLSAQVREREVYAAEQARLEEIEREQAEQQKRRAEELARREKEKQDAVECDESCGVCILDLKAAEAKAARENKYLVVWVGMRCIPEVRKALGSDVVHCRQKEWAGSSAAGIVFPTANGRYRYAASTLSDPRVPQKIHDMMRGKEDPAAVQTVQTIPVAPPRVMYQNFAPMMMGGFGGFGGGRACSS